MKKFAVYVILFEYGNDEGYVAASFHGLACLEEAKALKHKLLDGDGVYSSCDGYAKIVRE